MSKTLRRHIEVKFDKFTMYSTSRLVKQYIRKRKNLIFLPNEWFYKVPPTLPYLFFGLHMQPESSVDVWAPFYANQFSVIEAISRSTPPNYQLLVKLHKSDADNYSRQELDVLRRLPGVILYLHSQILGILLKMRLLSLQFKEILLLRQHCLANLFLFLLT